jgi:hypothetical protein
MLSETGRRIGESLSKGVILSGVNLTGLLVDSNLEKLA